MNNYFTIEEKYLHAVDKLSYGRTPKALQMLAEIINNDPLYARAHYQLGKIYYYDMLDYQTAGYHFKTCTELEPSFPDIYFDYLHLVVFLNMEKLVTVVVENALVTPGVDAAAIHDLQGLFFEKNKSWTKALVAYRNALMEVTDHNLKGTIENSMARVKEKMQHGIVYQYHLTG